MSGFYHLESKLMCFQTLSSETTNYVFHLPGPIKNIRNQDSYGTNTQSIIYTYLTPLISFFFTDTAVKGTKKEIYRFVSDNVLLNFNLLMKKPEECLGMLLVSC